MGNCMQMPSCTPKEQRDFPWSGWTVDSSGHWMNVWNSFITGKRLPPVQFRHFRYSRILLLLWLSSPPFPQRPEAMRTAKALQQTPRLKRIASHLLYCTYIFTVFSCVLAARASWEQASQRINPQQSLQLAWSYLSIWEPAAILTTITPYPYIQTIAIPSQPTYTAHHRQPFRVAGGSARLPKRLEWAINLILPRTIGLFHLHFLFSELSLTLSLSRSSAVILYSFCFISLLLSSLFSHFLLFYLSIRPACPTKIYLITTRDDEKHHTKLTNPT